MNLSERKQRILKAVIDEYTDTVQPISSKTLQENHIPEYSSATIRGELSALEDMGYLIQPHTSSGRVPTPKAYKTYIDQFIDKESLNDSEKEIIKEAFNQNLTSIEDIVKRIAKTISEVTNYASIVTVGKMNDVIIENIKLVSLPHKNILIIIVTDAGIIKDNIIQIPEDLDEESYQVAEFLLNKTFDGKKISELNVPQEVIESNIAIYKFIFDMVIEILNKYSKGQSIEKSVIEGTTKLLEQPEYSESKNVKNIISRIQCDDIVKQMFNGPDNMEFNITIGKEDLHSDEDFALISAKYTINGKDVGRAGVIGPVRMDYNKVFSVLEYISKTLNTLLLHDTEDKTTYPAKNYDKIDFKPEGDK